MVKPHCTMLLCVLTQSEMFWSRRCFGGLITQKSAWNCPQTGIYVSWYLRCLRGRQPPTWQRIPGLWGGCQTESWQIWSHWHWPLGAVWCGRRASLQRERRAIKCTCKTQQRNQRLSAVKRKESFDSGKLQLNNSLDRSEPTNRFISWI